MVGDKQSQTSGDDSINIQGRDISIGLSYTETRQVAMDVFEANFVRLRDIAADVARSRAEALLDTFLKRAAEEGHKQIPEAENPDFQAALFTAQKEYARTGDEDLGDLLVRLLVDRTKESNRNLMQIVLNESLTVAPKLTVNQLDALSLIFILKYTRSTVLASLKALHEFLDKFILPFVSELNTKMSTYQHLEFAGCGAISLTQTPIGEVFRHNYPGIFSKGFTPEELEATGINKAQQPNLITNCLHDSTLLQINALNSETIDKLFSDLGVSEDVATKLRNLHDSKIMSDVEIKEYIIREKPALARLFEVWEGSSMKNMTLTSVGIAIAHGNMRRRTGESFDLTIWI